MNMNKIPPVLERAIEDAIKQAYLRGKMDGEDSYKKKLERFQDGTKASQVHIIKFREGFTETEYFNIYNKCPE